MTETNAEWSAIDFINRTITRDNGFTATLIDAVEEVIYKAERVRVMERDYKFGAEQMETLVKNHNKLDSENKRLREALNEIDKATMNPEEYHHASHRTINHIATEALEPSI